MNSTGGTSGASGTGTMLPPGVIRCDDGGLTCDAETSFCCQRRPSGSECLASGSKCKGGAELQCSGTSSCDPGEVCCYHARRSQCQATCDVSEGGGFGDPPTVLLCNSDSECSGGQTCVLSPRGLTYCADEI
jgi:hypothetical protein